MKINNLFGSKKSQVSLPDGEMRIRQLRFDFDRVSKLFSGHTFIRITEAVGNPPSRYVIVYKIDGLVQSGASIEAKNEHSVTLMLPDSYPNASPKAKMLTPLYHPNVSPEEIDLKDIWTLGTSLSDLIVRIGELITFQRYNLDTPKNSEASQWAIRNRNLLPLSAIDLKYNDDKNEAIALMETKSDGDKQAQDTDDGSEKTKAIVIESEIAAPAEMGKPIKKEPVMEKKEVQVPMKSKTADPSKPNIDKDKSAFFQAPPQQKKIAPSSGTFCMHCGSPFPENANFCSRCGLRTNGKSPQRLAKMFFIVGMIAIPIIIIEGAYALFLLNKKVSAAAASENISTPPASPDKDTVVINQVSVPDQEVKKTPGKTESQTPDQKLPIPVNAEDVKKPIPQSVAAPVAQPGKSRKKKDNTGEEAEKDSDTMPANSVAAVAKQSSLADNLKLARLYMGIGSFDDAILKFREVVKIDPFNQEAIQGMMHAKKMKSAMTVPAPAEAPASSPAQ